jgi:TPP-dependent pyruvate/acetoin dehydrogenase alpha subunit
MLEKKKLLELYNNLFLTRIYDSALKELSEKGLWTFYHGIIGEDAIPVGVCSALRESDYVIPVHRTQMGVMVSRGVSLKKLTAELLGREAGYCKGISGTHMACMEKGVLSKTGILGAGLPVAVGVGLAQKIRGTNAVVAVFIGDGASSSGNFHEALNLASIWSLPVVFVLENNNYAITTSTKYAIAIEDLSKRASGYGIPGITIDGNDVIAVREAAENAVSSARKGEGPTLIECKTYRIIGHSGHGTDSEKGYRSSDEVEIWKARDPVKIFREKLIKMEMEPEIEEIESEAKIMVQEAVTFAIDSPFPTAEAVLKLAKEA